MSTPTSAHSESRKRTKFRHNSSSIHGFVFRDDQQWVGSSTGGVRFLDYGAKQRFEALQASIPSAVKHGARPDAISFQGNSSPRTDALRPNRGSSRAEPLDNISQRDLSAGYKSGPQIAESNSDEPSPLCGSNSSIISLCRTESTLESLPPVRQLRYEKYLSVSQTKASSLFRWPKAFQPEHSVCLLRFWVDEMAPFGDVGDPMRHSTMSVPHRARACPLLLNAVLLTAAVTISRLERYKTDDGICHYRGVAFPAINRSKLLELHNLCISELIEIGRDPAFVQDENIFAAVVTLRYHEELDLLYNGTDREVFLNLLTPFLNAQPNISLQSRPADGVNQASESGDTASSAAALDYLKGFRHAVCRISLRQEVTAAYLNQRPLRYPLAAWDILDKVNVHCEEDFVWSDRSLLQCARAIEYCYGSDGTPVNRTEQKWLALKAYEAYWKTNTEASIQPFLQTQPDRLRGQVFYQVSFWNDIHLTARHFFELSRLLLLAHNRTVDNAFPSAEKTPRLIADEIRRTVIYLCSTAVSYTYLTPAFIQAAMAVVNCGRFFGDRLEQDALLSILLHLDKELGWPASHYIAKIGQDWEKAGGA